MSNETDLARLARNEAEAALRTAEAALKAALVEARDAEDGGDPTNVTYWGWTDAISATRLNAKPGEAFEVSAPDCRRYWIARA